jgi:hypothetical protein
MKLTVQMRGLAGTIQLDGQDIFASGLTLKLDARSMPLVVLEVPLLEADVGVDADEAIVIVPEETAAILVQLGWTAPLMQEESEEELTDEDPGH